MRADVASSSRAGDGNFAVVKQCQEKESRADFAMKIIDKKKLKGQCGSTKGQGSIRRAVNQGVKNQCQRSRFSPLGSRCRLDHPLDSPEKF